MDRKLLQKKFFLVFFAMFFWGIYAQNQEPVHLDELQDLPLEKNVKETKRRTQYLQVVSATSKSRVNAFKTVSSLDLNGPMPGVNQETMVNAANTLIPIGSDVCDVTSTSGTITSVQITFSTNSTGAPAGVPNNANEFFYIYNAANSASLGNYQISATSATIINAPFGTNTFRISHSVANVFNITEAFGQPIQVANLEALFTRLYFVHTNITGLNNVRFAVVSVTDPNNTLTAYTRYSIGADPVAVDDTNTISANTVAPVTGNLVSNDTDTTAGDIRTIDEVHGYAASVGTAYNSTYGSITVQSNGAYSYAVDVNDPAVRGLKTGSSLTDIIAYRVRDIVGNYDFGYLTITINGVTEPPVANDNTNTLTVGGTTIATGNVITDDSGLGVDRLDRNTSLFIWESQYANGAAINGTNRTVSGVTVSFVKTVPVGVEGANNQTIDYGTNGGHTGYLYFVSNPAVNPAGDNQLTVNFSKPVTNLSFAISDIDFSQGVFWQDQMRIVGSLSGNNVSFNSQVAGYVNQTGVNSDTFYGTGSVPPTDAHGNVTISFNSPIDKLDLYYNYGPNVTAADPGGQIAGVTDFKWQDNEASGVLLVNGLSTNVGIPVAGTYGTFVIYADGSYTYTLNSSNPAVLALTSGQTLTDSIPYTISDNIPGSGNTATANLIITITCTPPAAPTVAIGAATCASPGTATITNYDSSFTYTFSPSGPTVGAGGVISNLTPNTSYTATATVGGGGCTSNASSAFSISPSLSPAAPTAGTVTQPTCSTATGSFQITGYNATSTYTFTPSVVSISGTGLVTANAGTYTFTETNASGCTSPSSANIVVNAQPVTPAAPTAGAVTQPTCSTATGSFQITGYNATSTYTFTPSVVSISGTGLVTANAGTYTFTETNASGCTSPSSANIVVNAQPVTPAAPTAGAVTQPTCSTATGSFQITGYNATSTYTFTPSVVSISGTGLVTANAGTYTFTETNASGCTSPSSANIVVNAQPVTPAAPTAGAVTQPTCSTATGSFQITGYNATSTYTFTPSVVSISGTGLVTANAGTYTFTETNASGCTSPSSANIVVNAQPVTPAAPTAGAVTQPTCSTATGSFQITGYNATSTYTFTPSVVSISGTGLVTANAGTYTFTETNASGCTSPSSANIVVNAQPVTPAAPTAGAVTQPTCSTATGSFQITGYNATSTYTFTPSVVSISGTGLVTANAGTYTFTETNASGCTSPSSANIVVNAQPVTPAAPTAGAVTQPTCSTATGSFQITGYNATSTYTFTPSVVSISGTGLVTANAGTYTFTETNASGCTSPSSANIVVNAQPVTPAAPTAGAVTQPTCSTATGSFQITGYNATSTYTFTPSVVSISGTGLVTANAGTYTFTETNASGCTSPSSANIVVNAQPVTPAAPTAGAVTQPTCSTATGSFQITGYNATSTYTFTPSVVSISGTGLVTANAGTYTFTETNASGCTSPSSANIVVNAQPVTPAAPTAGAVTQPTCSTATGSFQITGYNATSTYTFTPSVVSISGTGLVTANAGTYTFTETNASGCTSPSSANIVVNAQPVTPAAPTAGAVTQPTCSTATGSFQITGYNATSTYTFTPSVVSISGTGLVTANAGTYTFTETNASGCTSPSSANIVVNAQPVTPAAPTAGAVTQPTCSTATGSFQITGYNATSTYTFTPSVVSISGTGLVTANAGTYTFTETNASGCTSPSSANIVVNAQPVTPAAPTAGAVTQPTCSTATGSFQITGYNATSTYTFTPSVVSISGTGLVTANAGTYTFTETNASGCTSPSSANIVVNAQPVTPAAPTAGAVTQPTCSTATGSFQITGYNATSTYTFTPSVVSISGTGLVTANAGTYTFTETNASGCTSPSSANIVVNAQPVTPAAPTAGAVTQPTCSTATGSFQITGYNATSTYTFTPSVVSISGTGLVTANAGTYTFTETNASGCTSPSSANIVVNAQPVTPAAPTAGAVTQPTCSTATGSFQITGYNATSTYTFTPSVVSISGTGLVTANAGTYTFTETNASGCTSPSSANIVVNNQICAITETTTPVNGLPGGTTTALTANDTLNGAPVTVGTAAGNVQITSSTVPSGWTMNADGTVTIPANTPAGTYSVTYTICEVNNPTNCDTVTSNVVVSAPVIDAIADTTAAVNGLPGGTTTALTANDTLNGAPVTVGTAAGNVQITSSTVPSGWTMNADGTVTIPANTPAGTYSVTYTICEVNNPTNCDTVTSNVVVSAPVIDAIADTTAAVTVYQAEQQQHLQQTIP